MENNSNQSQPARSSFVTALAWTSIVLSGFATLIGIAQNVMINTMMPAGQMSSMMHAGAGNQNIPPMIEFTVNHVQWIFAAFLVLSAVSLVSSIALLRRKNWGRLVFIGLMWLTIIWNVAGIVLQKTMLSSMTAPLPGEPTEFQEQFKTMATTMQVFSVVMAVAVSVLSAWIIKKLMSRPIRDEFDIPQ